MEQFDTTAARSLQPTANVSSLKGLLEVFYQPANWFQKLSQSPKVFVPYVVLAILTFTFFYFVADILVKMQLESPQLQEQLQGQNLPPNAVEMMWWSTIAGGSFVMLLAPLVAGMLALFWGNIVFAGKATFKEILSVMLYGEIIYAVGNLLMVPLVLIKKSMAVGINPGILVADRGIQDPLFIALSKIDLFIIWEIIVIGIGLSAIYNFDRNKGLGLSVLSMGLMTLLGIAGAFIGSLF